MMSRPVFLLLAAAVVGAVLANLGRAVAEPQPAWDREMVRQLIRAQDGQRDALEASVKMQEQQARALQELARTLERAADKCRH